jgi:hypothetical protein
VRLAQSRIGEVDYRTRGLPSAQGVWAASLLDAGILGLEAWILFLGGVLVIAGAAVLRRPDGLAVATFVSLTAAVLLAQLGEDRLDVSAWALIALALAAATRRWSPSP